MNIDSALEYARRGWRVFPCHYVLKSGECSCGSQKCGRIGKHPSVKNGVLEATVDEKKITDWWTARPYLNISLATGYNNLIVMDIDTSADKVGKESLAALEIAFTKLPETLQVTTGSGGLHYYFTSKSEIKNSANKVGQHIDVRGMGGYVILPPSNHKSGQHYSWLNSNPVAPMPEWLEKLMGGASSIDITEDRPDEAVKKDAKEPGPKLDNTQLVRLLDFIPADCDRDVWWQIGAALKQELGNERGWTAWDGWSKKAPNKYDEKVAMQQWGSFIDKGLTGATIFFHAQQHGFRGFEREAADSPEIKGHWIFVLGIKRFVDLNSMQELDAEQFSCKFAPLFSKGKASDHVLRNDQFTRVDAPTYWPNNPQFVTEDGFKKLNYWRPSGVTPALGDIAPFLAHVNYLFPKPEEAKILLDFLAFQVQQPGVKVHWAPLLYGVQGTGKSYLGRVMEGVLGAHNVRALPNEVLHEATFTGWQKNTQLIIVEELMARGRLELMNKLKPMITEPWCSIREMYRPPYDQANRFNFMLLTNHADSILIDNTDRRYCVLASPAQPHSDGPEYYAPLFKWTDENASALLHWFLERDLSEFEPKAHAPMTEGKRELILESMQPLDAFISEHVTSREWPFNSDLVIPSNLVSVLAEYNLRHNPKEIGRAFVRLGYTALGNHRVDQGVVKMWAVRDAPTYQAMSAAQLRQAWVGQVNNIATEAGAPSDEEIIRAHRPINPVHETRPM